MGWDSFGLPAENAAIENHQDPSNWTERNISQMRNQLNSVGYQFNWRESTSDPSYYKWTQWLFLKLFNAGLAYKGMGFVNWDPVDCTVLADEQVDEEGRSWRSGAIVEKRCHRQWFIRTTSLAKDLYDAKDIASSRHWKQILGLQRNWIKKPTGYVFYLSLSNNIDTLTVFTKYPELFTHKKAFIAISNDHWLSKTNQLKEAKVFNPFINSLIDIRVLDSIEIPHATEATLAVMRESFEDEEIRQNVLNRSKELNIGGYFSSDKYRDWLISRQRYWGTPIPIVNCKSCGPQPVPENELPVKLPPISDFQSIRETNTNEISSSLLKLAPQEW